MKNPLIPFLVVASLTLSSCKEDEAAKQKIVEMEETIATLKTEKVGLEAKVISLNMTQSGMSPGDAKALKERKEALELEVQRLLSVEMKVKELTKQNEELATKLAAATMTSSPLAAKSGVAAPAGAEISKAVADSFVLIEGDHHSGGGFLAAEGANVYLYTAASVFAGNQKLTIRTSSGQALKKFGNLELCDGLDIARMQVLDTVESKLEMVELDAVIPSRLAVFALGMPTNTSAVAVEKANVTGATDGAFAMDNRALKSARGGPVIHAISGKVVGVIGQPPVTPTLWPNQGYVPQVLQAVTRLNQKMAWTETKIGNFLTESKRLEEFDDATRLAAAVSSVSFTGGMPQLEAIVPGSNTSAREILTKNSDKSLAQSVLNWKGADLTKKIATNEIDIKKKWRGLLVDAQSLAQRGTAEMKPAAFSWYYRAWAEASLKERQQVLDRITQAVAAAN